MHYLPFILKLNSTTSTKENQFLLKVFNVNQQCNFIPNNEAFNMKGRNHSLLTFPDLRVTANECEGFNGRMNCWVLQGCLRLEMMKSPGVLETL